MTVAVNYLFVLPPILPWWYLLTDMERDRYRYGTLIVFANYLIESKGRNTRDGKEITFPEWLREHREITKLLGRRSLD